jgi:hypothetical protein|tara:strand:+ start:261 stop:488 length:228 start_codon:yes stop_codon:yes gene_type:complete
MGDNIVNFPNKRVITDQPVPIKSILLGADRANLEETIVIGWNKKGEFYFASSEADGANCLWLLEKAKIALLNTED